jgi:hypothetical protein
LRWTLLSCQSYCSVLRQVHTTRSLTGCFDLHQRKARVIEEHATGCGERDAACLPLEEFDAECTRRLDPQLLGS